jgi:excisionase family DNA binding protein
MASTRVNSNENGSVDSVLTVNELASYLRVHPATIYRLLKSGKLPGFRVGFDWRFNREAIDEWVGRGKIE